MGKTPWPETASDFVDFPVEDNQFERSSILKEQQKAAAEIKAIQSSGNKEKKDDTDREKTKLEKQQASLNSNDIAFSGLLKAPKDFNDWFQIIDAMVLEFYREFGCIPNKAQAWTRLCNQPPKGYSVTLGKHNGETALLMKGLKSLGRRSFNGR